MTARWQPDTLALSPDLLSILIGINDIADLLDSTPPPPAGAARDSLPGADFRSAYDELLARTRSALPSVRLVLGEPFYLPTSPDPTRHDAWTSTVAHYAAIVRDLAADHNAVFVPFQQALDEAATRAPAEYWIWDGIHPTYAGQRILADTWITAVTNARR